ncbi:hypothetical protein E3N88_28926 [Mikania micrantha]|uniref:Uncharacterized protein n=1 Tax=Mikania micrantha TaxID=192012 RepID=A0A5N6N3N8_9ASTR|nr:hypothetical protein E3N88_28926 [Mikania micrantha]
MTNLTFGDKHNVCAYLDPTTRNGKDFRPMIEFLRRSRIYYAISNSCHIYRSHIQSFWESARLISVDEEKASFAIQVSSTCVAPLLECGEGDV